MGCNRGCFERVAAHVGSLVEVDGATSKFKDLEFARLRVRTTVGRDIRLVLDMKINDILCQIVLCTVQVVGSDDVAASYYVGVLSRAPGWQKGRKSGGSCSRQLVSWRAPISSIPKSVVTGFEMKSSDANLGKQVIRDRRKKDIAEGSLKLDPGFRGRG